ncbi:MAG: DMT family transporter [Kiritimatiellia bacterium]
MPPSIALLCAVIACGCSTVFIRESRLDAVSLAAFRLLAAALLLSPAFVRAVRRAGGYRREWFLVSLLAGLPLGIHLLLWNFGARLTLPGNATLLVTLSPLFTPLLFWWLAGERVTRRELAATALGLAGAAVLAADSARVSAASLTGDLLCLLSMGAFCFYLAAGRRARTLPSLWVYVVPVYATAGALCWVIAAARGGGSPLAVPAREWIWILGLVVVCTMIGHTLVNHSLARLRGQVVSVSMQGQFVVAAFLGWRVEGVLPRALFYPAAALTLGGILLLLLTKRTGPAGS